MPRPPHAQQAPWPLWPALALPKREWGPRGWNWLHLTAINYPLRPTPVDARVAFRRIWQFIARLPCAECRAHALRFVSRYPPRLASTYSLQAWVWGFHNAVNFRLGKPLVPYAEYLREFADEICWAHSSRECGE